MKRAELLRTDPCATFVDDRSNCVLAKSQLLNVDHKVILNIDLFYQGILRARYFASKEDKDYITYMDGQWSKNAIMNIVRKIKGMSAMKGMYYWDSSCYWCYELETDNNIADSYLNYGIDLWEDKCRVDKREKALERKKYRINDLMNTIPKIPVDFKTWAENEFFSENYLFVHQLDKKSVYSCTACGASSWRKAKFKHGKYDICPKCGCKVKVEKKRERVFKHEALVLLQVVNEKIWVERQLEAECIWSDNKKEIDIYENIRVLIPVGETSGTVYYGTKYLADECNQDFWTSNPINRPFLDSYLYPANLKEVLPFVGLKSSGLDAMAINKQMFNVNKYILAINDRPWLEYLSKGGLTQLTADFVKHYGWQGGYYNDFIYKNGHSMQEFLKIDSSKVLKMKQMNGSLEMLKWLQYEEEIRKQGSHVKITDDSLEYLLENNICIENCRVVLEIVGSVNRMVNYLKKQKGSINENLIYWRDYLTMSRNEGLDITDDIVRFPKELKLRHDQIVQRVNEKEVEGKIKREKEKYDKLNAKIKEHIPQISRYYWENDDYAIIPATRCEELLVEGKTLHHCVGSSDIYMQSMAQGDSWILFMRKKETMELPYYTIEIDCKNNEILQWYSAFDRKPNEKEVSKVLKSWIKTVKKMPSTA